MEPTFQIIPVGQSIHFVIEFTAPSELCLWDLPLSQRVGVIDASALVQPPKPTRELSQCLGLRQPYPATSSGPEAHRRERGGDECSFYCCGTFFSYGTCLQQRVEDFSQHIMVFCCPAGKMVTVCFCRSSQSYSNDEHSPEPRDMLRSSPSRSHRHSVGFVPTVYNGTLPPSEFPRMFTRTHACHALVVITDSLTRRRDCALVRFSPPGSVSLPRRDGRDEESSVYRAQSPRSHQQLSICRLPDLSPAHPHQVTSFSHSPSP